nr:hypothetical protein BaRGS_027118 [Batillaria attramentaria]
MDRIMAQFFLLEVVCSVPMIATLGYPMKLKDLFVPLFLNCWLARGALKCLMLEEIGSTWAQRKKTGGDYGKRKSARSKHVIVCGTSFTIESVMNFLNEFYEHQKSEGHTVVLMSSEELDGNMLFILKDPKVNEAEAVFFLLNKNCEDRNKALATESWQQVYGRHSGNEIYHIQLNRSNFFRSYEGQLFAQASAAVHQRPDQLFLETIAHFPLVYWMVGSLKSIDDLLKAGIRKALHLVISHIGAQSSGSAEETLEDAETIVMVQKIARLFPSVNIITEVNEASNMRFMHFQAQDSYLQEISRLEKVRVKRATIAQFPTYDEIRKPPKTLSYVIVNPSPKRKLKNGDMM